MELQALKILDISPDDVERTCGSEFTEEPSFILNFSNSTNKSIREFVKVIRNLKPDQNIWSLLTEDGLTSSYIQVWTFYIFHYGLLNTASFNEKERSLLAAQLYIVLLQQPGSGGSQLCHGIIFEKLLNCIKKATPANNVGKKRKSKKTTASQEYEDMVEEETVLTHSQAVALLETLTVALKDYSNLLLCVSFKDRPLALKQSVEVLVNIIKCFNVQTTTVVESDSETLMLPSQLAFKCLRSIVCTKHGDLDKLSTLVYRLLMTTITMRHAVVASSGKAIPRSALRQSEAAISLVTAVYEDHKDDVADSTRNLMQNVVAQCPDRMEAKDHMAVIVSKFTYKMPIIWYADFIGWLVRFAYHNKIGYRNSSLAVIGQLLRLPERTVGAENNELLEKQKFNLTHRSMLESVMSAITAPAPTVRSKALLVLADVLETHCVSPTVLAELLQSSSQLFSPNRENISPIPDATPFENKKGASAATLPMITPLQLLSVTAPSLCVFQGAGKSLLTILCERASENKFVVRKTAVYTLEVAMCNNYLPVTKEALDILNARCRDPLLSVRKNAIQTITKLLKVYPDNVDLREMWVRCLFPSIMDAETSMQEKASQLIENQLLTTLNSNDNLTWDLLKFLTTEKGNQFCGYLRAVSKEWRNQGRLTSALLKNVISALKYQKKKSQAWMLLSIFTLFTADKLTASSVITKLKEDRYSDHSLCVRIDMITTAGQVAKYMSEEDKKDLLEDLKRQVESHSCPIQLLGPLFEAIEKIVRSQFAERGQAKVVTDKWHARLLSNSDNWFSDIIMTSSQQNYNDALMINHLYVVGEAAQRCERMVPKRLLLSIQALLATPEQMDKVALSQASQPLSQFRSSAIPPNIRAHTIFNLGRMCLRNETLAKRCVPAIARELETCEHEVVRNNVLIVLTDLCVLQTQLVDQHFPTMAVSLADESTTIRKHAVILISSLLQKEYVKWKGTLLFKYLHAACDVDEDVRSLARYFLLEQLLRGQSVAGDLFYRNFVACLFYYNSYDGHNIHKFTRSEREKKLFDLSGSFPKRMELYEFLLLSMEDEHRINLTGKLCTDVLESFVEGIIPLNKDSQQLLTDTLSVLCCKEIRLKCLRSKEVDPEIEDEIAVGTQAEQVAAMKTAAKQKLISQIVKKNLVENIVPIIIALKNLLAEKKSPMLKNVMLYLKEVMQEYRSEVQQILSEDKQLASEIEFDLKRFEREQEEAKIAALSRRHSLAGSVSTPNTPRTPGTPLQKQTIQNALTPATLRRERPMNIQAIIKSARKSFPARRPLNPSEILPLSISKLPESQTSAALISQGTPVRSEESQTRAASTPVALSGVDVTFAKDISVIASSTLQESKVVLLQHPEKTPPPRSWNITSPDKLRRSNRSKAKGT